MYYAQNGKISQDPIPGGIQITKAQYDEALEGMQSGKVVTIADGFSVAIPATPESETPAPLSIEELKQNKNSEINFWRAQANSSTFPHQGKTFACDALSRSDIDGVANNIAMFDAFPAGFPGGWKAIDNAILVMPNIDAFKSFYQSMTAQGTANFNHAQALKAQLAAANTEAEIDAIKWE